MEEFDPLYVLFSAVDYFEGFIGWTGANLCVRSYDNFKFPVDEVGSVLLPSSSTASGVYAFVITMQVIGGVSIIVGMLTAGFMQGILVSLASLFDFAVFLVMVVSLMKALSTRSAVTSIPANTTLKFLILIVALSVIQLRANLVGHRVVTMLGLLLLAIPFVGLYQQLPIRDFHDPMLIFLFVLLALWLKRWGELLQHTHYGGQVSTILMRVALIALPITFLFL